MRLSRHGIWGDKYFFTAGSIIEGLVPPQNELAWWDGDPLREIHSADDLNGRAQPGRTEGSVQHVADLLGDWREEIVTFFNGELRITSRPSPPLKARHPDAGSGLPE